MNLVADLMNQALDALGSEVVIGDPEEGSREAQVLLRAYEQCLRQLLRAAHWAFARRQAPLALLADATGATADVGTQVVDPEFLYEYEYPTDCLKLRFIPWNSNTPSTPVPAGNIQPQNAGQPITSAPIGIPSAGRRLHPARWLETVDPNYPAQPGTNWYETQGVSPQGRVVICTNVKNACAVYTGLILYPSIWDALFREALVCYLASQCALAILKDKKFALTIRAQLILAVKEKLVQARLTDGNEGTYSSDIKVDWIETRRTAAGSGYGWGLPWGGIGAGYNGFCGPSSLSFADGSAY